MKYQLHPEAALEHEEQAAYFELRAPGLGQRYNAAFKSAALRAPAPLNTALGIA